MMTEHISPNPDMALHFIKLITARWDKVGDDLSLELRALGTRPQSLRFNPKIQEEVAIALEAAAKMNAKGSNVHISINPAGPYASECKTRALKDADIVAATATFLDADEPGIADNLPDKALARPDFGVVTGLQPHARAHFYWLLQTPISDFDRWRWFQKQLAQRYGTDPAVCNISRVMRLPGFVTHPNAAKVKKGYVSEMTRLVVLDGDLA